MGGSQDFTDSIVLDFVTGESEGAGWERVAGSGNTKTTAAANAGLLSWQQASEHFVMPACVCPSLSCPQSMGLAAGVVAFLFVDLGLA